MAYFKKAKKGDKVYGLVFGLGKISGIYKNTRYKIMVEFENGEEIPYTQNGIPGSYNFKEQTLFYKDDIDLTEFDFTPSEKVLSPKKIIKYREKKKLEVRLPSGIWSDCNKCAKTYIEELLQAEKYHLFRKKPK